MANQTKPQPVNAGQTIGYSAPTSPPLSVSARRPRWKGRVKLGVFFNPPGTQTVVNPVLAHGMTRVHIQRVRVGSRRLGWLLETYWGRPADKRAYPHLSMGNEDRPVESLAGFKARLCDCGNPICFGSLTSQDVAWLVRFADHMRSRLTRIRTAAKSAAGSSKLADNEVKPQS